jgi:hypothetical protein
MQACNRPEGLAGNRALGQQPPLPHHHHHTTPLSPALICQPVLRSRVPQTERQHQLMVQRKYPHFWLQSFLVGVPKMALGRRSKEGQLLQVRGLLEGLAWTVVPPHGSAAPGAGGAVAAGALVVHQGQHCWDAPPQGMPALHGQLAARVYGWLSWSHGARHAVI